MYFVYLALSPCPSILSLFRKRCWYVKGTGMPSYLSERVLGAIRGPWNSIYGRAHIFDNDIIITLRSTSYRAKNDISGAFVLPTTNDFASFTLRCRPYRSRLVWRNIMNICIKFVDVVPSYMNAWQSNVIAFWEIRYCDVVAIIGKKSSTDFIR